MNKNTKLKRIKKPFQFILKRFLLKSDRGRFRTPNPQSRNLIFYPVELRGPNII